MVVIALVASSLHGDGKIRELDNDADLTELLRSLALFAHVFLADEQIVVSRLQEQLVSTKSRRAQLHT